MENCLILEKDLQKTVLEILRIQKEIFHYTRISIMTIGENKTCTPILDTGKVSKETFKLKSIKSFKSDNILLKSELKETSELYSLCQTYEVDKPL